MVFVAHFASSSSERVCMFPGNQLMMTKDDEPDLEATRFALLSFRCDVESRHLSEAGFENSLN